MDAVTASGKRSGYRGWLILLARWAFAFLILAALIYFLPLGQLREALARVAPNRFASVLVIYLLALAAGILKWHLVVNSADARLPFSASAQCYAGGLFGALFLPSIVGGDAVRLAVGIARSSRPTAVVTGNVVDRLLDLAAQLTLVLLGILLLPGRWPSGLRPNGSHLALVAVLATAALLLLLVLLSRFLRRRSIRFRRRLVQLRRAKDAVSRHPYRLLCCWLLGILVQGTFLTTTVLLGTFCGLHLPFRVWLFAWPISKMAGILPITQGGIGVRETALLALLRPFGAPGALVVATGIVSEGVIICGGLLAGLLAFLLQARRSKSEVATVPVHREGEARS